MEASKTKNALCTNAAQEHCASTWYHFMETNTLFITMVTTNAPVTLILLIELKMTPFQTKLVCILEQKLKVFHNQYIIARDLKILCRSTAQSDAGSIEKHIWFTAGEIEGGSIISTFPGIASGIDYLISHFSQKVHQRLTEKNKNANGSL